MIRTRRLRDDGGAVIVEAALVLPILLAFFLGLFEYSIVEFQQSQATSAARDGARAGIVLDYSAADQTGSPANLAIEAAVRARLLGQENVTIVVRCVLDDGTTTVACSNSALKSDQGFLSVAVSWPYESVTGTGLFVPSTITGTTKMSLVGVPVTISTTTTSSTTSTSTTSTSSTSTTSTSTTSTTISGPPCGIVSTPNYTLGVSVNGAGKLLSSLTIFNVVTNGALSCGTLQLEVWKQAPGTGLPSTVVIMNLVNTNSWDHVFAKQDGGWNKGQVTFAIKSGAGTVLGTYELTLS